MIKYIKVIIYNSDMVTTVGPDGVPHEETSVTNLSESSESLREHPLRIPMMDGFFPGRPSGGADHHYHPTESPEIKNRNLFLIEL